MPAKPEKKNIWISAVVVPILGIVIATIFTPLGNYVRNLIIPVKSVFEGMVKNEGKPVRNLDIYLDSLEQTNTDSNGKFIFTGIKKGKHTYALTYNSVNYQYFFYTDGATPKLSDQVDVADTIQPPAMEHTEDKMVKNGLDTTSITTTETTSSNTEANNSNNQETQPKVTDTAQAAQVVALNSAKISEVRTFQSRSLKVESNELKSVKLTEEPKPEMVQMSVNVARSFRILTAAEIVKDVKVKVKINYSERKGKELVYNYYLDADENEMSKIKAAYYVRNNNTFNEFKNKSYISSYDSTKNYGFKAYQWGRISSVYLTIILKNGDKSPWVLKDLEYENLKK